MVEDNHSEHRTSREVSNANLKPFKPGESGNPGGRPKDTLTPLLREYLNADDEAEKRRLIKALVSVAKATGLPGQVSALREIFDRIDGRVPETHRVETDVPISIVFKKVDKPE